MLANIEAIASLVLRFKVKISGPTNRPTYQPTDINISIRLGWPIKISKVMLGWPKKISKVRLGWPIKIFKVRLGWPTIFFEGFVEQAGRMYSSPVN